MGPILPIIEIYFVYFICSHFGKTTDANCPSVFQPWDCRNRQGVYLRKPIYILYSLFNNLYQKFTSFLFFSWQVAGGLRQFTFHHANRRPSWQVWSEIASVMMPVANRCLTNAVGYCIACLLEGIHVVASSIFLRTNNDIDTSDVGGKFSLRLWLW